MLLVENRDLLDRFRRGERDALGRVFEHYAPAVSRWAQHGFTARAQSGDVRFSGFRSAADVHDVVHETFRSAFEARARQSYSGLTPFEGWLFVITRNVILKKLKRPHVSPEPGELEQIPSTEPSPEEKLEREEQRQLVQGYLATLDEDAKSFVTLRFTEQLAQMEVGEKLGWSRKKVRLMEETIRTGLTRFLLRARGSAEVKEVLRDGAR